MTYTERVARYLEGIEPVNAGACPGCRDCGLDDLHDANDDPDRYDAATVSHEFTWHRCEACRRPNNAGRRFAAHGSLDGDTVHLDVCDDCRMFIAYGDVPEDER